MKTLEIRKELNDDMLTISPEGRIDTMSAPSLEAEIAQSLDGVKQLVIDFSDVYYISSAGLRVVVALQKTMTAKKGSFKLRGLNEDVLAIFTAVGLTDILDIE